MIIDYRNLLSFLALTFIEVACNYSLKILQWEKIMKVKGWKMWNDVWKQTICFFVSLTRNLIQRGNKVNWEDIIKWWESLEVDTSMNEFNVNCGKLTEICYLLWCSSVNWTIQWILFPNIPASLFIVWDIISFYDKMQWKNAMIKCNVLLILILIDTNKIFAAKYFCV